MTSLKELDAELLHSKAFSVVNGVDMRKLCKFLVPEKDLIEVTVEYCQGFKNKYLFKLFIYL
jgi:hypothetical protein